MRIYVGRLPFTTKNAGLLALFAGAGTVTDVKVMEEERSGQGRGFGFVEMPDAAEARAAITKLNGYIHYGRPLTVTEVKPPIDRIHSNAAYKI